MEHRSTRREFCAQACGAAGLVALGSAMQACGGAPGAATPAIPVVMGPASRSLRAFRTSFASDILTITL